MISRSVQYQELPQIQLPGLCKQTVGIIQWVVLLEATFQRLL